MVTTQLNIDRLPEEDFSLTDLCNMTSALKVLSFTQLSNISYKNNQNNNYSKEHGYDTFILSFFSLLFVQEEGEE